MGVINCPANGFRKVGDYAISNDEVCRRSGAVSKSTKAVLFEPKMIECSLLLQKPKQLRLIGSYSYLQPHPHPYPTPSHPTTPYFTLSHTEYVRQDLRKKGMITHYQLFWY